MASLATTLIDTGQAGSGTLVVGACVPATNQILSDTKLRCVYVVYTQTWTGLVQYSSASLTNVYSAGLRWVLIDAAALGPFVK